MKLQQHVRRRTFGRAPAEALPRSPRLGESATEAQLWLTMNFTKVTDPAQADAQAKARAAKREKKRVRQQATIDELLAKRKK